MDGDFIFIRGARTNNLKNVSVKLARNKITVFAGVSGSGKTSLVFDTIAAEAVRQLYETFPLYIRNRMPYYKRPLADELKNLTTAVVIDQRVAFADARSTVGTMAEISPLLRLLYSRFSTAAGVSSKAFSFNDPEGMCPVCAGLGRTTEFDLGLTLDLEKSLNEGAILFPGFAVDSYQWQLYANSGVLDPDKPLKDYSDYEREFFLHGKDHVVDIKNNTGHVWDSSYKLTYEGFEDRLNRLYLKKTLKEGDDGRNSLKRFTRQGVCAACSGRRINERALSALYKGESIFSLGEMEIDSLIAFLSEGGAAGEADLLDKIISRLRDVSEIGLGYLNLNRPSSSLSGGETQRLKIVRHLGSSLTGLTYIFDEPSIGLHKKDIERLNEIILRLRDRGNTILIVEHDGDIIRLADEVVELGPGAGAAGGRIIYQGNFAGLLCADTPTGMWLRGEYAIDIEGGAELAGEAGSPAGGDWIVLENCRAHNLKNITVRIRKNSLTVITGVAGAGKSTLAGIELCSRCPEAVAISQTPIGTNARSNPASYIGIMDEIRKQFAAANGTKSALYSFNSRGACPVCSGKGVVTTEMAYMDPVTVPCEACLGTRYNKEALEGRLNGMSIVEVLDMTVSEAIDFFDAEKIKYKLRTLQDVGLGYLRLGQPTDTLSGGECQRVKLAAHMRSRGGMYILDEPTGGLHGRDIALLNRLLKKLVANGNSVVVVDNKTDVIKNADYVIELGPGGGSRGGELLFEGTAGEYLKAVQRGH